VFSLDQGSTPCSSTKKKTAIRWEQSIAVVFYRDYCYKGAVTTIELFDDRVEITNPGGLVSAISSTEFGKKESLQESPQLVSSPA
jgi:predicted HTH transcriptional regulator